MFCYTINVLRETIHLEHENVGLYTLGGRGLKMCTVCTLLKMLTFMDGPLVISEYFTQMMLSCSQ